MNDNSVNFLPEDYVENRAQQRTAILFVGLFLAVMVAIVLAYLLPERRLSSVLAERDHVNHEYEEAGKRLTQLQEMEREKARMITKAEVTAYLLERVPRSVLLAELTKLMPRGVSMLNLELKSRELSGPVRTSSRLDEARGSQDRGSGPEPVKPPPVEVTVNVMGMAPSDGQVAAFIAALGKSPLFKDVNLVFSEEFKRGEEALRRFKVDLKLNPEADVRHAAKVARAY